MAKGKKATEDQDPPLQSALSITFSGPFLFDFARGNQDKEVDIYAPFCPLHEAGFFFSSYSLSETDLCKPLMTNSARPQNLTYSIHGSGIKSYSESQLIKADFGLDLTPALITPPETSQAKGISKNANASNVYILQMPTKKGKKLSTVQPCAGKTMFKLIVPMPKYVASLYYDFLEVVDVYNPKTSNGACPHSTSLRFYYEWDAKSDIKLAINGNDHDTITPPVYKELPTTADIEVRYEGIGITDENDPHSDARSCFASLATLAGLSWWPDYGDKWASPTNPSKPGSRHSKSRMGNKSIGDPSHNTSHTGNDCHAAVIINGPLLPVQQ